MGQLEEKGMGIAEGNTFSCFKKKKRERERKRKNNLQEEVKYIR